MKLLVMSDSHGRAGKVKKMIAANADADAIIYLGDGEKDLEAALAVSEFKRLVYQVRGNCDRESKEAVTLIQEFDGVLFYITHGYEQSVKYGLDKLSLFAEEQHCSVALFGHTHGEHYSELGGVKLFNPGSAANGSYGVITVAGGNVKFEHHKID